MSENHTKPSTRQRFEKYLVTTVAIILPVLAISDAMGLVREIGLALFKEQLLVVYLGLAMTLAFLHRPFKKTSKKETIPWYDYALVALSVGSCSYVAVNYEYIFLNIYSEPTVPIIAGTIILGLLLDSLRRAAGIVLFIFLIAFLLLGVIGNYLPSAFQGRDIPVKEYILYLSMDSNALLGLPIGVVSTIVVCFIFFGNLLNRSHGATFYTDISMASMGHYRGGAAKIAVIASSLLGSISGSAVANVASSGVVSIPLMKRSGFPGHTAGGIEAVASTGGQLMPPMMGAAAFVMAELLQIDFTDVVLAALLPAVLYYFAIFIRVDLYAAKHDIAPVANVKGEGLRVFLKGWFYFLPFVVIIYALFAMNTSPQYAALLAAATLVPLGMLVGYNKLKMQIPDIIAAVIDTGLIVFTIILIASMAGVVIGVLNISGLGFALTQVMVSIADTSIYLLLLLAALVSIILGMGMPTLGVYLLLATLVAPAMVNLGIEPLAAHMFALYFGMLSMITPPVCVAAFTAASISDSDPMKTGYSAAAFGWSAYLIPFIFVLAPEMLMVGSALEILIIFLSTGAGIYFITSGFVGYIFRNLKAMERILTTAFGFLVIAPNTLHEYLVYLDVIALVLFIGFILNEFRRSRQAKIAKGLS